MTWYLAGCQEDIDVQLYSTYQSHLGNDLNDYRDGQESKIVHISKS
jgi:hypothetical protein